MARSPATAKFQRTFSRPSPIGGLNVNDALTMMQPTDCVISKNWIPYPYGSRVRKGFREWATDLTEPVHSILVYYGAGTTVAPTPTPEFPTAVNGEMFAVTDDEIYDITSATDTAASVHSLSGADYAGFISQSMFSNIAGSFLLCASETDGYFYYDGTNWVVPAFGSGAGEVGGVDPADVAFVFVWKRRVWFVKRESTELWYLPTDQITGTAVKFDVGPFFKKGGAVSHLANWTIDAGTGMDDMLVIVGDRGDVLVYKGTDPSSISTFGLIGSWEVGEVPRGRRSTVQYGGDLLLLSNDGLFPLSHVTRGGAQMLQASMSDYTSKIQEFICSNITSSFNMFGWGLTFFPRDSLLLITVPDHNAISNRQFVMSTIRNGWCLFDGIPAMCMNTCSGYLFAGTPDGRVLIVQDGFFDQVPYGETTGIGITGEIQPAFDYFEAPGAYKNFLMVRPTFLSADRPGIEVRMNTDFAFEGPSGTPAYPTPSGSVWDVALWDSATWGGQVRTYQQWIGVQGVGFAGSLNMRTVTAGDTQLASIDYMVEYGGPL